MHAEYYRVYQMGARGTIWHGPQAQMISKFKRILVMKSSLSTARILCPLSWISSRRYFFTKCSKFECLGCYLTSLLQCAFLSVCLLQRLRVKALSMCWNRLIINSVQLCEKTFELFRHAQYQVWPYTKAFFTEIIVFPDRKSKETSVK
jgi:hypothetical protein